MSADSRHDVTLFLDRRRWRRTSKGSFGVRVPARRLRPGSHRLTVRAVDAVGNRMLSTFLFRRCAGR